MILAGRVPRSITTKPQQIVWQELRVAIRPSQRLPGLTHFVPIFGARAEPIFLNLLCATARSTKKMRLEETPPSPPGEVKIATRRGDLRLRFLYEVSAGQRIGKSNGFSLQMQTALRRLVAAVGHDRKPCQSTSIRRESASKLAQSKRWHGRRHL